MRSSVVSILSKNGAAHRATGGFRSAQTVLHHLVRVFAQQIGRASTRLAGEYRAFNHEASGPRNSYLSRTAHDQCNGLADLPPGYSPDRSPGQRRGGECA